MTFTRPYFIKLTQRLAEDRRFIQVIAGPRQVGKTTLVHQVIETAALPFHFASADAPTLQGQEWIAQQWNAARLALRDADARGAVLVLDEIQKIPRWSEIVKALWDEDTRHKQPLKVLLLGSAPLLIAHGLTESLAGRFEVLPLPHWSFTEMKAAFGWSLEHYLFYGAYPGAAPLIDEPERWKRYIVDALIETTISRDVLLLSRVDKPALLRRLFQLGCQYSGQLLSYTKMLGQLQDAGNVTTLAHYLDLLAGAGMVVGLQKYAGQAVRQRGSSPKLQVLNTALMTVQAGYTLAEARADPDYWGRLVESAIGAHLANAAAMGLCDVFYWRDRNKEVDFVVVAGRAVTAIEVKSGRVHDTQPGMDAFATAFSPTRTLLVGSGGIAIEEFLDRPVEYWVKAK